MDIIAKVESFLAPIIEGTDMFVVSMKVKPTNNIKIYIDADDGFSIDKSISVNRQLRKMLDESGMFPDGDYSLEVSSPGVDEPLKFIRQYKKNIGRKIQVTTIDEKVHEGKLVHVADDAVTLEVPSPTQKKTLVGIDIPFNDIKQSVIQISF